MIDSVLKMIAPHHCCGCDAIGPVLCDNCKNYITKQPFAACVVCGRLGHDIKRHHLPYQQAYCVGWREKQLAAVIDQYKFRRAWAAHLVLAELLDKVLPDLPPETLVVPIPTAPAHIRIRGYDHMELIAQEVAHRRELQIARPLRRRNSLTQHFARTAAARHQQAKQFFELAGEISIDVSYLLIDDIFTTGSTLKEAAQLLADAGVQDISCAMIARARQS